MNQQISIAHSPDSDDHFFFLPLRLKWVDCPGVEFVFADFDTQELNSRAKEASDDVIAISAACYHLVAKNYLVLPHGASIGRNYGPVLAALEARSLESLNNRLVAIPGEDTTAALLLRSAIPAAKTVVVPIQPFNLIYEKLMTREVEAAVIIHEGQLSVEQRGLKPILNLGHWWEQNFHLPLPLGINVIRRSLDSPLIAAVSHAIHSSILTALERREELLPLLLKRNAERGGVTMTIEEMRQYLQMYANVDSLSMDDFCREGLRTLSELAAKEKLKAIDFAP